MSNRNTALGNNASVRGERLGNYKITSDFARLDRRIFRRVYIRACIFVRADRILRTRNEIRKSTEILSSRVYIKADFMSRRDKEGWRFASRLLLYAVRIIKGCAEREKKDGREREREI